MRIRWTVLVAVLLSAAASWGAVAQSGVCSGNTWNTSTSHTLNIATTLANADVVTIIGSDNASATVQSITGLSASFSCTAALASGNPPETGSYYRQAQLCIAHNVNAQATPTLTITLNASANWGIAECMYTGADHVDTGPTPSAGAGSPVDTGIIGVRDTADFLVAGLFQRGSPTFTAQNGTLRKQVTGAGPALALVDHTGALSLRDSVASTNLTSGWGAIPIILRATADSPSSAPRKRISVVTQ